MDIQSFIENDPAAKSLNEVVLCYPGFKAIFCYRIAHVFYQLEIPLIPRLITELAHSKTGIDIHPGAKIGKYFFIEIDGISYADSEAIRLELQKNKILNSKFSLTKYRKELLLKDSNSLVLSSKYNSYKEKVYNLLITLEKEDRYVPYYGKPFSYYYHIIEKKNS